MALEVLKSAADNADARRDMISRDASMVSHPVVETVRRWLRLPPSAMGDRRKSWDVWKTARFLEDRLPRDAPIVDFGAYQSEILPVLHRLGFRKLTGIDLNPRVTTQPFRDAIDYRVADFYKTPFDSDSVAAVTSISALEHGLDLDRLLQEVARILRPGGYFVASTDYWPRKIDTSSIVMFGMSWTIFSAEEIERFLDRARSLGLQPVGAVDASAVEPVIHHAGKSYTFAWLALQKATAT